MRRSLAIFGAWLFGGLWACSLTVSLPGEGSGSLEETELTCASASDCPPPGNRCVLAACIEQRCIYSPLAELTPLEDRRAGDCASPVCDNMGGETVVASDDAYDDANDCTVDSCQDRETVHANLAAGTACADGVCDGSGRCVECVIPTDCASGFCIEGQCVPAHCVDMMVSGNESATDCGGDCVPCDEGEACNGPNDCESKVCTSGICAKDSCSDQVENGSESDVDCGGDDCPPCADGQKCGAHEHCLSKVCTSGICAEPSCSDGVKNGTESDQDCGGTCSPCGLGADCNDNPDCSTSLCVQGSCCSQSTCAVHCTNNMLDGDESDVDCGGSCPGCSLNQLCNTFNDCANADCCDTTCLNFPDCD